MISLFALVATVVSFWLPVWLPFWILYHLIFKCHISVSYSFLKLLCDSKYMLMLEIIYFNQQNKLKFLTFDISTWPNTLEGNNIIGYFLRLTACNTLQETLHKHNKTNKDQSDLHDVAEGTTNGLNLSESMKHSERRIPNSQKSLLKNWPLVSAIIVYCVFQLHDIAYLEVFLPFLLNLC